jgi:hypothetical protein
LVLDCLLGLYGKTLSQSAYMADIDLPLLRVLIVCTLFHVVVGNFRPNPGDGFSFAKTNMSEVLNSILGIGSDSVGLGKIPLKFLKLYVHVVLPFITHIFNTAILLQKYPTLLN